MATNPAEDKIVAEALASNETVLLQAKGASKGERHRGLLYGNVGRQYLLLGGFENLQLQPGDEVVIRMVIGNYLLGFDTRVTQRVEQPDVTIVDFPSAVETLNLRKAERIHAFFPADVKTTKNPEGGGDLLILQTRVVDISAGGCSFRSKTAISKDTALTITFSLPGERQIHSITASALDCARSGGIYTVRVQFPKTPANALITHEIQSWIADNLTFAKE